MSEFKIDIDDASGAGAVIRLIGELDIASAPALRNALVELAAHGTPHVQVDLAEVPFMDSTGLGVLVAGLRRFRATGGDMELTDVSDAVYRLLELTGLTPAFRTGRPRRHT